MTVLELDGVIAGYGSGRVLHDVSLAVAEAGMTALLGANGAGKTTTLRAISGMLKRQGTIGFGGRELPESPSKVARLGIAHVPEGRGTLPGLTVDENLLVGALLRRDRGLVGQDLERCQSVFPVLRERRNAAATSLSGGEQQMLAIGRALMSRPALLLLDEPSLGLAPRVTEELFALLPSLRAEWGWPCSSSSRTPTWHCKWPIPPWSWRQDAWHCAGPPEKSPTMTMSGGRIWRLRQDDSRQ